METRVDLSKVVYVLIMLCVLFLSVIFNSCVKRVITPASEKTNSSISLSDLLAGNFYCYRAQYTDSNTLDVLLNLSGFGVPQPAYPSFEDFTPFQTFGEGNTWLTYTGSDSAISFGWMHRTPYDETNEPTYSGYDDIYTWTLDVVKEDEILFYYFVEE